jgi:hypothetical protein
VDRTFAAFVWWDVGISCSDILVAETMKSSVLGQKGSTSACGGFEVSSVETQ